MCAFAGVAEQFAIAEAKLRAWSSVDGDESNDDSYDEDFLPANEPTTQSTGTHGPASVPPRQRAELNQDCFIFLIPPGSPCLSSSSSLALVVPVPYFLSLQHFFVPWCNLISLLQV